MASDQEILDTFDNLKLGIEKIDKQHLRIFHSYHALHDAVKRGGGCAQLGIILYEMSVYVREHFNYEEKQLKSAQYANIEQHIEEHRIFKEKIAAFEKKFEEVKYEDPKQGEAVAVEAAELIYKWLISHINENDRKYVEYVRGGT